MTISELYQESEELTSNFSKITHEVFMDKSKELSLKVFNLINTIEFPQQYNPEFSTIIARSVVFLDERQKIVILDKIIKSFLNKSSIKLQRSYGGIVNVVLGSITNLEFLKNHNPIIIDKSLAYDSEYIRAVRTINQKIKEISN